MTLPPPRFKLGDRCVIVGCLNDPACNGRVVTVIGAPDWDIARSVTLPDGSAVPSPADWWYPVDLPRRPRIHESRLRPWRDGDEPGSWDEVERMTGWVPEGQVA